MTPSPEETAKNKDLTAALVKLSEQIGGSIEKAQGVLLYEIAAKQLVHMWITPHVAALVGYIRDSKLKTTKQLEAAFEFLKAGGDVTSDEFSAKTGVGVVVTEAEIEAAAAAVIEVRVQHCPTSGLLLRKREEDLGGGTLLPLLYGRVEATLTQCPLSRRSHSAAWNLC